MRACCGGVATLQNDLDEFYALTHFAIPNCLGDPKVFDRDVGRPILKARDLDATDKEREHGLKVSNQLFTTIKTIMLR